MEWIVLLSVIIATLGQLHAYPNKEMNENDLEEAMLAQWLRVKQESLPMGVADELLQDDTALEQTNPLCTKPEECNCQLKNLLVNATSEPGATCFSLVPYCEGPCKSVYR